MMRAGQGGREVGVRLDGQVALVEGRRRGRWVREVHGLEDTVGSSMLLRNALRSSSLLRAGRRCRLRVDWDPTSLLVRMSAPGHSDEAESDDGKDLTPLDDLDPQALVVRAEIGSGTGRALEVVVRKQDVDDLASSLGSARFEGRAHLDVGVIARSRRILDRMKVDIAGRSGFIVDVSFSTVCVLLIQDGVVQDLRCAARVDPGPQAARMMAGLMAADAVDNRRGRSRPVSDRRRWFSIHAPLDHMPAIRAACRATLPPTTTADLHVGDGFSAVGPETSARQR
jgi:hypothetical protein